jgi:hypothetical protein
MDLEAGLASHNVIMRDAAHFIARESTWNRFRPALAGKGRQ